MAKKRTKQYTKHTLGYILKTLRLLDQNEGKVRTTARQLVLKDKKTLREWRDNREAIVAEVRSCLKANQRATTRCCLAGGGSKPLHQEVEVQLVAWLTERRQTRSVTPRDLWDEAEKRLQALKRDARISDRWKAAFKRRWGVKFRAAKRMATIPIQSQRKRGPTAYATSKSTDSEDNQVLFCCTMMTDNHRQ